MLRAGLVHVWSIGLDMPPAAAATLAGILDAGELDRWHALRSPADRRRFLAGHGATRMILARYLDTAPRRLAIRTGRWGKPEVEGVQFSLSHSGRAVLLAVTRDRAVGIDVERATHPANPDTRRATAAALAARFFPPGEAALVAAAEPADRSTVYNRLWVRKEACVKACGARLVEGLALPVSGRTPILVPDPSGRLPGPWLVRDLAAPPGYAAAVALAGPEPFQAEHCRWHPGAPSRQLGPREHQRH